MENDMFSGWGWRTLAASEPVFNPLSYHRGSVWPHEILLLLTAWRSTSCVAARSIVSRRSINRRSISAITVLPELFCGVQRGEYDEPVHYPGIVFAASMGLGRNVPDAHFGARHPPQRP